MARKKYTDRFNKTYKTYRKRYYEKKRYFDKLNRKNLREGKEERYHMREEVMSKSDFYSIYNAYKQDLKDEGIKNPNVVQYIVSDQAYKYSRKQFQGMKRALNDENLILGKLSMGKNFSEVAFRTGQIEIDFDQILSEYHYLREELGYSVIEAQDAISLYYWGSE